MKAVMVFVSLCAVAVIGAGCIAIPAGIAASTEPLEPGKYTEIGPASGSAYGIAVMGIPASEPGSPTQIALGRALNTSGGDALIRAAVDVTQYNFLWVTVIQSTVSGTAVRKAQ